jgi:DNA-binding LytR/AlgR family response regulator
MEGLRTFILEDDVMMRNVLRSYVKRTAGLVLTGSSSCPVESGALLAEEPVDLLFLDIGLPILDGFRFLASLASRPLVVVVSARPDHAAKAFDHDVIDYLYKPFTYERFLKAVERARASLGLPVAPDDAATHHGHVEPGHAPGYASLPRLPADARTRTGRHAQGGAPAGAIMLRTSRRVVEVSKCDIELVQSMGNYVKVHLWDGGTITATSTLSAIEEQLPPEHFVRIHRTNIIAINAVRSLTARTLEWRRGMLPIGSNYKRQVLAALGRRA